jgi:sugar fermentation stimulation protein A
MEFSNLVEGVLARRYQRFLTDVTLNSGEQVVAHCPNTGAMTGMNRPGSRVWLSASDNPKRKLRWTWELVETAAGLACVHSAKANTVVGEALRAGALPGFERSGRVRAEVALDAGFRVDFLVEAADGAVAIEVKAVTLLEEGANGVGRFPDARSERALRHVQALADRVRRGDRAVLLFCALHNGIDQVAPASAIDPDYATAVRAAAKDGVEVRAVGCHIDPGGMRVTRPLPVLEVYEA